MIDNGPMYLEFYRLDKKADWIENPSSLYVDPEFSEDTQKLLESI
jgi:hypothetical protein